MFKKRKINLLFLSIICLIFFVGCAQESQIKSKDKVYENNTKNIEQASDNEWSRVLIVTENYPPLNYMEDGILKGSSADFVKKGIKNIGFDIPIKVYPWARSYEMAKEQENVFIFSISRTPEREDLFKWVALINSQNVYLYALSDREITINNLEDIKKYKVSAMSEDFTEQGLKRLGYGDYIISAPNQEVSVAQLFNRRTDLWIATARDEALDKICEEAGYDSQNLKVVFEIDELKFDIYIATGLKTSDEVVRKFREAMPKTKD